MMELIDTANKKRDDVLASSILKKTRLLVSGQTMIVPTAFKVYGAIIT